jgi:hypothetical protein
MKHKGLIVVGLVVALTVLAVTVVSATQWEHKAIPVQENATLGGIDSGCIPSNLRRVIPNTCFRIQPDPSAARNWAGYTTSEYLPSLSTGGIDSECIPSNLRRVIPNTCFRIQPDPSAAR